MAVIISNAFSFNMISQSEGNLRFEEIPAEKVKTVLGDEFVNACGHSCELINSLTGLTLVKNRINNSLVPGDTLVVCQYVGPRLAEGATSLPDGATMKFLKVTLE